MSGNLLVMQSDYADRFWHKVNRAGPVVRAELGPCWTWTGRRYRDGYGEFRRSELGVVRRVASHRVAWELTNGAIPTGLLVLHRCDNPPCCNPDHLFLGNTKDNVLDMWAKGRGVVPVGHLANAILSADDVQVLRAFAGIGLTYQHLADRFGVSPTTVREAATGRTWVETPGLRAGPRKRGPRKGGVVDGRLRCSGCETGKPVADFPPSVVAKGNGWCTACYAAWGRARRGTAALAQSAPSLGVGH